MVTTAILVFAQENATQSNVIVIDWNRVEELKQIQAANEGAIFKVPGVVGIGMGFRRMVVVVLGKGF